MQSKSLKQVIECPECGSKNEAESVQSFPKNLALLNMSQSSSNQNSAQSK